ncbi:hypothetical protein [Listeria cornellensis]|uniref:hypothetical protein n=1 Tax=Listeria cornellensis TaxID=1494961 RepID=UPI00055AF0B1|nr:hypothetical protein [Listeria cornellensis]
MHFKVVITDRNNDKNVGVKDVVISVFNGLLLSPFKRKFNRKNNVFSPVENSERFVSVKKHLDELDKKK